MLGHASLPEPLIKPCIAVLDTMQNNERDLVRIVVEVINELRDFSASQTEETEMVRLDQSCYQLFS